MVEVQQQDGGDRVSSVRIVDRPFLSKRARRKMKKLMRKQSRNAPREPIACQMAKETIGSDAAYLSRKFSKLKDRFEKARNRSVDAMLATGQIQYAALSFEHWLLDMCHWSEASLRPRGIADHEADAIGFNLFMGIWRWWLGVHPLNQLEIASIRHRLRR